MKLLFRLFILAAGIMGAQLAKAQTGNCTAAFTYTVTGCTICFTDISTLSAGGTIAPWSWSFGDGTNSTQQNPCHTYFISGTYAIILVITDAAGCVNTFILSIPLNCTTGIEEASNSPSVSISQNPFTAQATFTLSKDVKNGEVKIYNVLGKEVMRSVIPSGAKNLLIERGNLSSGVYFYTITSEEKSIATGKLIIQ